MTKHNKDNDKHKSPDIRKILINNTIIYKDNNKNRLQPEEVAEKVAQSNIVTKRNKLQLEYMGIRRIKVTVSNVPVALPGHVLASFLTRFGRVEDYDPVRGAVGAIVEDYSSLVCLKKGGASTQFPT